MKKISFIIQNKLDILIYKLARNSIRRICKNNPDLSYLLELSIINWRRENLLYKKIDDSIKFIDHSYED